MSRSKDCIPRQTANSSGAPNQHQLLGAAPPTLQARTGIDDLTQHALQTHRKIHNPKSLYFSLKWPLKGSTNTPDFTAVLLHCMLGLHSPPTEIICVQPDYGTGSSLPANKRKAGFHFLQPNDAGSQQVFGSVPSSTKTTGLHLSTPPARNGHADVLLVHLSLSP